jgi:hypothetical protein
MAISLINVGQIANDGTGDDLREAFIKINQNFEELDLRDDEQTTASNVGGVGEGIFANRVNYDLQFKKIVAGSNISLASTAETVTINAVGGLQQLAVVSDNGSIILRDGDAVNLVGGTGIETSVLGNTITISNTSSEIVSDTTPQLGGNLDAQNFNITAVNNLTVTSIQGFLSGNIEGNVWDIDIRTLQSDFQDLDEQINGFDLGTLGTNVTSLLDYLAQTLDIDFGTVVSPSSTTSDFGSL